MLHNQGEVPVAHVVAKKNTNTNKLEAEIFSLCKQKLPSYSYPYRIVFKEELPYTLAGKVDCRRLQNEEAT